jgi:hypothetical protein
MWNEPTEKQLDSLPKLYETEHIPLEDKIVKMHFFLCGCDWYAVEYNPEDHLFFGYANLNDKQSAEWGYFSLDELKKIKVSFMQVDRDLHWQNRPFKEVYNNAI